MNVLKNCYIILTLLESMQNNLLLHFWPTVLSVAHMVQCVVCLSVCRLWRFVFWTDLHEIFREGVEWPWDNLITFWVNSGKPRDAAMLISLSATIWENGWTDLHEIFREGVGWPWDNLITFSVNSGKPRDADYEKTDAPICMNAPQLLHRSSAMGQYGRPS